MESSHLRRLKELESRNPQRNAYVERFTPTSREDVLDANALMSLGHAQALIDEWRADYNSSHPHSSLGDLSPLAYRQPHHEASGGPESVKAKANGSAKAPAALTESAPPLIAV